MSITAWIILGLAVALLAGRLIPRSRTGEPPALLAIIGVAGVVSGDWTASILIARQFTGGSGSPATWPAAVARGRGPAGRPLAPDRPAPGAGPARRDRASPSA
jgi:uncharacterized membrane protein YeaQ/YmgE (transglycosylase-associated protein family)